MVAHNLPLVSALTLIGLGLLANALAKPGGTEHGSVFAAGGRGVSETRVSWNSDEERPRRRGVDPSANRPVMAGGSGCIEADPLDWFGEIRPLEDCGLRYGLPAQDGEAADVDVDGRLEYFGTLANVGTPDVIASGGKPLPNRGFIYRVLSGFDGTQPSISLASILETEPLAKWILSDQGWTGEIWCGYGWIDIDGDGDLDLQLSFNSFEAATSEQVRRIAWLENTGFEATQPLTGDLNSDGNVDPADLALLLGGWTGG